MASSSSSSPFLMHPVADENTKEIQHLSFYNLKNNKPYNLKLPPCLKNTQFQCIGSSKGWLAFLNQTLKNPFLFNPSSQALIHLPQNHHQITKLILSQDPSLRPHTYAAVAIQTPLISGKLSFSRNRDATWHDLSNPSETYYDAVCCDATNTLFALAPRLQVESWNLNDDSPTKTTVIRASFPRSLCLAKEAFPRDLYSSQLYLALASGGGIVTAVRYVGDYVRYDGEAVCEGDTLTDYMAAPLVCPYRTMGFRVLRADVSGGDWGDVEGLGDYAMFVGGNETAVGLRKNAIYFTDDYWERIDEDYSYGGHDFGVFCMKDSRFEHVLHLEMDKINPPPFWITLPSST
ncbi:hypothetical protein SASPL_124850 [Salvia splendens]|uniref:KIB1-4 beta-propeller domain-containing protein n=1 Tax=Salvia splendens TaxID=180675 RepID=A0A8X8XEJ2_SALSN|nr:uncharacterized protein LOC121748101 [Salvia splendens]KAG6412180.1 hypothetical protein SASPL_124850 [Salvia splendens]